MFHSGARTLPRIQRIARINFADGSNLHKTNRDKLGRLYTVSHRDLGVASAPRCGAEPRFTFNERGGAKAVSGAGEPDHTKSICCGRVTNASRAQMRIFAANYSKNRMR